jgi:hypothetical protein
MEAMKMVKIPGLGPKRPAPVPRRPGLPAASHAFSRDIIMASANQAVQNVLSQKKAGFSFLEMVPFQYRSRITDLASDAWAAKWSKSSLFKDLGDLTENLAVQWLAKKEAFTSIAKEKGFEVVSSVKRDFDGAILGLSANGSLVGLSPILNNMTRMVLYGRIELREDSKIPPESMDRLLLDAEVNKSLKTSQMRTSPLIMLASKSTEGKDKLQAAQESIGVMNEMSMTLMTIDGLEKVWVPRDEKHKK